MYLPDDIWNIVKEYQINWKLAHKKKLDILMTELRDSFDHLCCYRDAPCLTVHKITGHFHKCFFACLKIKKVKKLHIFLLN